MDSQELKAFRDSLDIIRAEIQRMNSSIGVMDRQAQTAEHRIFQAIQREKDEAQAKEQAQNGFSPGKVFYIDRHDGVYVLDKVTATKIHFQRKMDGSSMSKLTIMSLLSLDPRLTPLRTQGPYEVGDAVSRDGDEFKVEGYLGFRMVLSRPARSSNYRIYTIVQKKDEKTYRSIII